MKRTSAVEVIIQPLWPGPDPEIFEATCAFAASAARAPLFTYASRSVTRCSSDGDAAGDDDCAKDCCAMKPIRTKRSARTKMFFTRSFLIGAHKIDKQNRVDVTHLR